MKNTKKIVDFPIRVQKTLFQQYYVYKTTHLKTDNRRNYSKRRIFDGNMLENSKNCTRELGRIICLKRKISQRSSLGSHTHKIFYIWLPSTFCNIRIGNRIPSTHKKFKQGNKHMNAYLQTKIWAKTFFHSYIVKAPSVK